jgi:hypothetical protein
VSPFNLETPIRRSLALVAVWLIIVNIFALMAFNRLNITPDTAFEWMSSGSVTPVQTSWNIIDLHNRWDSYWYLDIAKNGYYLRGEADISNVVFFPLYPLLVRWLGSATGGNLVLSGWILSSVFLALAACMLARLTQEFHPDIDPQMTVVFLLVYPMAFYLNAVYSESLFLFLSLAAVYCALKRNFPAACVWAALASATRLAGVFLAVLVLVEFVQTNGWRSLFTWRVWPLAVAPLGALAFFAYHWIEFGDFFLYLKAQSHYGRTFILRASDFAIHNNPDLVNTLFDVFYGSAAILLGVVALWRLRLSYGLYMLVSLGTAVASGTILGLARYALVLFPIHLIGAGIRSTVGRSAWLLGSTLLLALNIICFVNHYWAD